MSDAPRAAAHPALSGVVIDEPETAPRIRLPTDLFRLVLVLFVLAASLTIGTFATQTSEGVESDVTEAVSLLPGPLLFIINLIVGVGFLGLAIAVGIDLILRRRGRLLLDALIAVAVASLLVASLNVFIVDYPGADQLQAALTDPGATKPMSGLLAAITAFFVVARVGSRRVWLVSAWVVVLSFMLTALVSGGFTLLSMISSTLFGLAVGLLVRYGLGTQPTRPSGSRIALALIRAGIEVTTLERVLPDTPDGRRYLATGSTNGPLDVHVLDRDQEGSGLAYRIYRMVRVRPSAAGRNYVSVRRALEHEALLAHAASAAGVRTSAPVVTCEVGAYAALLAYPHIEAKPLSDVDPESVHDDSLDDAWEQLGRLRLARIAHRGFNDNTLLISADGHVHLQTVRTGEVAATDLALRIDVAQLLTTFALVVGAERAVRTAAARLGTTPLADALPLLQPLAMTLQTRAAVRKDRQVLKELRAAIIAALPHDIQVPTESVRLERLSPRALLAVVGGTVAAYLLVSQLNNVDVVTLFSTSDWRWSALAIVFSVVTYLAATLSLVGFVASSLPWIRTFLAQLASTFVSLVAPAAVGGMALNMRFLAKNGVGASVAVATVGVWQAAAFAIHLVMLVMFGVIAGTQAEASFDPPQGAIFGVVLLLLVASLVISLPWGRRVVVTRITEAAGRVVPALFSIAQNPGKLAQGIGGNVILNLAYCGALVACVRAFGGELAWPAIAIVYLAGSAIGSLAPTPGGLGAVEAALAGGLTAAGLDGATAISAVLLFRLYTYWIPVLPGWAAFRYLQNRDAI